VTVPPVPLPTLGSLLAKPQGEPATSQAWFGGGPRDTAALRTYHRASYALASAVESISAGAAPVTVWLPAYFCDEAADPIRAFGAPIRYYELLPGLHPDWNRLEQSLKDELPTGVMVLVHFFGFPSPVQEALEFCRRHGLTLVEDAAHAAGPTSSIGQAPFVAYSPRKLFAVPSGGCLVIAEDRDQMPAQPAARETGMTRRWVTKRIAQKLFRTLGVPWHKVGAGLSAQTPARSLREPTPPPENWGLGRDASAWLDVAITHGADVVARRRANYERLLQDVRSVPGVQPLFSILPAEVCPYALPLLLDSNVAQIAKALQRGGVPASRWPDLPEEVVERAEEFAFSTKLFERLLLLPIHQGLTARELSKVGRLFREAVSSAGTHSNV